MDVDDVKVRVLNNVFNDENIKKRVDGYVDKVYCPSHENRKIRKAFKNQIYDTIKAENKVIMESLRILERKPPIQKRRRRKAYTPTPYVVFCREMKIKHPNEKLAGKIQKMWKQSKSTFNPKETELERQRKLTDDQWLFDNIEWC